MFEELQKRKDALKKTETQDKSDPVLNSTANVQQFKEKIHAVNLENWIEELKEFTYDTTFIDLKVEEAKVLVKNYSHLKKKNSCFV